MQIDAILCHPKWERVQALGPFYEKFVEVYLILKHCPFIVCGQENVADDLPSYCNQFSA